MTTPVPQSLPNITPATHTQQPLDSEVISLLQRTLSLFEEVTPHLGDLHQKWSGVEHFWQHGEWDSSQVHAEEAEEVSIKELQVMRMRFSLHALLFALGVERNRVRGTRTCTTELPDSLKPGDVMAALELITMMNSLPFVSDEESEDFEDEPMTTYQDIPLF